MTEDKKNRNSEPESNGEAAEIVSVIPGDAPSENYLVAEHLQTVPSIVARGLFYTTLLLIITALAYSLLAKMDLIAECRSVARPSSHVIRILADRNGYVEQVFITEGQQVREHTPLFLIRSKETVGYSAKVDELRSTIPLREQNYDMQISSARDRLRQRENQHENTIAILNLEIEQNELSREATESDLAYWRERAAASSEEYELSKNGVEKGYLSLVQLNAIIANMENAKNEVIKLEAGKNSSLKQKTILGQKIAQEESDFKNEKDILEKEIDNLLLEKEITLHSMRNELSMNERMLSIKDRDRETSSDDDASEGDILRADAAGTISELYYRNPGEYITLSSLLCTIVPEDSPLYMDVTVANRDIGFIKEGIKIKYKFDAFPYTDYGLKYGSVQMIAPSAVENPAGGFVYYLRGTLEEPFFTVKDKKYPIKSGMTANAELVIENRTLFSIAFRKLRKQ
jgi:hemolysin D